MEHYYPEIFLLFYEHVNRAGVHLNMHSLVFIFKGGQKLQFEIHVIFIFTEPFYFLSLTMFLRTY